MRTARQPPASTPTCRQASSTAALSTAPNRWAALITVRCAKCLKFALFFSCLSRTVSYQMRPVRFRAKPPRASAARRKARSGIPESVCAPPLFADVWTKSCMCAGSASLPSTGTVVRGAGPGQRAQRDALHAVPEQPGSDQPVGFGRALLRVELLDRRAEDVRDRFVHRARLPEIDQVDLVAGDAVRALVADHVDRRREAVEQVAVAVAEHHLLAVPERIVVTLPVVHRGVEVQALVVDLVPRVGLLVEVEGRAETVSGFHRDVRDGSPPSVRTATPGSVSPFAAS